MDYQKLNWKKNDQDWYRLNDLDLNTKQFESLSAIFVIWRQRIDSVEILRIGKGFLKKRLHEERWQGYAMSQSSSQVCVSWALLDVASQPGAQRYLIDIMKPMLLPLVVPTVDPISVSLPWED